MKGRSNNHSEKMLDIPLQQDWILQALLNGIGAANHTLGEKIPDYSAMIIIELKKTQNAYGVQVNTRFL